MPSSHNLNLRVPQSTILTVMEQSSIEYMEIFTPGRDATSLIEIMVAINSELK